MGGHGPFRGLDAPLALAPVYGRNTLTSTGGETLDCEAPRSIVLVTLPSATRQAASAIGQSGSNWRTFGSPFDAPPTRFRQAGGSPMPGHRHVESAARGVRASSNLPLLASHLSELLLAGRRANPTNLPRVSAEPSAPRATRREVPQANDTNCASPLQGWHQVPIPGEQDKGE